MQEVFNWLINNYQVVISGLCVLIVLIVSLIKKKPINDVVSWIYKYSVEAINIVEASGIIGSKEKLLEALKIVKNMLMVLYPEVNVDVYDSLITKTIENILTTPQKKGVKL